MLSGRQGHGQILLVYHVLAPPRVRGVERGERQDRPVLAGKASVASSAAAAAAIAAVAGPIALILALAISRRVGVVPTLIAAASVVAAVVAAASG